MSLFSFEHLLQKSVPLCPLLYVYLHFIQIKSIDYERI